jgi:hypothetical protein
MSQVDDIPRAADIQAQIQQVEAQASQALMQLVQGVMQQPQMPEGGMVPQGAPMQGTM